MKFDIETILYIVVSIIIIAASTLGKRKKKLTQQAAAQDNVAEEEEETDIFSGKPFSAAELISKGLLGDLSAGGIPVVTEPEEAASKYRTYDEEPAPQQIIDEEEEILTRHSSHLEQHKSQVEEHESHLEASWMENQHDPEPETTGEDKDEIKLFANASEIQKSIIYSEIMRRPDY